MNAYEIVLKSREKGRPTAVKYIEKIVDGFIELHGDRRFADDAAVIGGIGTVCGRPVTVIGIEKGEDTNAKVAHNFGCAHPEGYRKAMRLMKEAEKFHRPVLCFVDTSGAYCGIGAEERGQAEAIASSIMEMIRLKTPALSVPFGGGRGVDHRNVDLLRHLSRRLRLHSLERQLESRRSVRLPQTYGKRPHRAGRGGQGRPRTGIFRRIFCVAQRGDRRLFCRKGEGPRR